MDLGHVLEQGTGGARSTRRCQSATLGRWVSRCRRSYGQIRSMIVALAMPPPSHIVCSP